MWQIIWLAPGLAHNVEQGILQIMFVIKWRIPGSRHVSRLPLYDDDLVQAMPTFWGLGHYNWLQHNTWCAITWLVWAICFIKFGNVLNRWGTHSCYHEMVATEAHLQFKPFLTAVRLAPGHDVLFYDVFKLVMHDNVHLVPDAWVFHPMTMEYTRKVMSFW